MNKSKYKVIDVIKPRYCSECPHMNMNLDTDGNTICDKYNRPVDVVTAITILTIIMICTGYNLFGV